MFGKDLKTWTPAVGLRYVTADRDAHKTKSDRIFPVFSDKCYDFGCRRRFNRDFAQTNDSLWHSEFREL